MQICYVVSPKGEVVRAIQPAWNLNQLHANSASYACGQYIPTGYAQQAVMQTMYDEGYSIKWVDL